MNYEVDKWAMLGFRDQFIYDNLSDPAFSDLRSDNLSRIEQLIELYGSHISLINHISFTFLRVKIGKHDVHKLIPLKDFHTKSDSDISKIKKDFNILGHSFVVKGALPIEPIVDNNNNITNILFKAFNKSLSLVELLETKSASSILVKNTFNMDKLNAESKFYLDIKPNQTFNIINVEEISPNVHTKNVFSDKGKLINCVTDTLQSDGSLVRKNWKSYIIY